MRLFVSYARVDKPYCIQIINTLSVHDVWYDQRLYAGQSWWREIMRRLEWCEGFLYLLSPESLTSEYCRREYELIQTMGKQVIPVKIHEDTIIPDTLLDTQYVDLSRGLTPDSVAMLLNSLFLAERQLAEQQPQPRHRVPVSPLPPLVEVAPPIAAGSSVIAFVTRAMDEGQFDKAQFALQQAKNKGFKSRFIDLDSLLRDAEAGLERQAWLREAEREYRQITELVNYKRTRNLGCEAFRAFQKAYPDHDPDCLAKICGDGPGTSVTILPEKIVSPQIMPPAGFSLPMLEWCDIPAGMAMIEDVDEHTQAVRRQIYVDSFQISKYPVTNAQYQRFLDDPMGYANLSWWQFSPSAHEWRLKNQTPKAGRFEGDERPRENVTWYDAMAFCHWLSTRLGHEVTLPTEAQWQRAAQGDDERRFPWGNAFEASYCNARESDIKKTTPVTRYPQGASPYGVMDMVGNIWEWCLDTKTQHELHAEVASADERAVHGGSYVSVHERSEIGFRYFLAPQTAYASIGFRLVRRG